MRRSKLDLAIFAALVAVSIGLQVYSLVMLQERKTFTAELNARVASRNVDVVISDQWFIPVDLVDVFFEKPVFFGPPKRRDELLARLRAAGTRSALFVHGIRGDAAVSGGEVVTDGWLRFSPVRLVVRRFAPGQPVR